MANGMPGIKRVVNGAIGKLGYRLSRVETLEIVQSQIRHFAKEAENKDLKIASLEAAVSENTAEIQRLSGQLQESNETAAAEIRRLAEELRDSEAKHAAAAAAFADVQRLNSAIGANVQRLTAELQESQSKYAAAAENVEKLSLARLEQEQFASIFRRKTEELTQRVSELTGEQEFATIFRQTDGRTNGGAEPK